MAHSNDKVTRIAERIKAFDTGAHKPWNKKLSFLRPPTRPAIKRVSTRAAEFESYSHKDWKRRPRVSARVASMVAKQKKKSLVKHFIKVAGAGFKKGLKPKKD